MPLNHPPSRHGRFWPARWLWPVLVLLLVGRLGGFQAEAEPSPPALPTFAQFRVLPREEALKGLPVRFQGVVLCYDAGWGQLYVHDGTETRYFSPGSFPMPLEAGLQVEISGATTFAEGTPTLTNLHLVVQGRQALPRATPLNLRDLAQEFGQWVEVTGRVRVAEASHGRLSLVLADQGQSCLVWVMGEPTTADPFRQWGGARVRVRGINASKSSHGKLESASLFAPGLQEIKILEPATLHPERLPVTSIDSLLNRELGTWTNELVHLNGFVAAYEPGQFLQLRDPTGLIRVNVVQLSRAQQDDWVDVWGFFTATPNGTLITDGYFELVRSRTEGAAATAMPPPPRRTTTANRIITRTKEVLKLSKEEAGRGLPVRLRGVITFADPAWNSAFLESADDAVYVELKQANIHPGQWVEVSGRTSQGGFAPEVDQATIQVLGTTNLPAPVRLTLGDMAEGQWDAHWVEMEGVIRRVYQEWGHLVLSLVAPQGHFRAIVPVDDTQPCPNNLIGALVRVQGACGSELNVRGQLSGVTLHVPNLKHVLIQDAPPADPFAIPSVPVVKLATYDPERPVGRWMKVRGVVTLPTVGQGFYLQDATGGLRVSTQQTNQLHTGDVVDVLGFPTVGDFAPYLEEAVFRQLGTTAVPAPRPTTAEQILLRGTEDGMLVQLEARLLEDVPRSASPRLALQDGALTFSARLAGQRLPPWRAGSILRLKGVCSIQGTDNHEPSAFRLLVARPEDVTLVRAPSWWTVGHLVMLLSGLALSILLVLGWVGSLRRQVRTQTDLIRQKQQELVQASRQAGMAEVATSVLHNVGNVLNSVNTSAGLLAHQVRASKVKDIAHVTTLLESHRTDLPGFLGQPGRADSLLTYLKALTSHLNSEKATMLREVQELTSHIDHIKGIVAMQQTYAKVVGVTECCAVTELVDDALRMHADSLERRQVKVVREFDPVPELLLDKHKVLQILINLISNAKYALDGAAAPQRRLTVGVHLNGDQRLRISVADTGIGIAPENLARIFSHGFTTRKDGHGFGLHS
jgi:signal transduction histidine kinase